MVNSKPNSEDPGIIKLKISARNTIEGTVKGITPGSVNSEVVIEVADGFEIVSIITKESAERMNLTVGKTVFAVIKASDVMIGTQE